MEAVTSIIIWWVGAIVVIHILAFASLLAIYAVNGIVARVASWRGVYGLWNEYSRHQIAFWSDASEWVRNGTKYIGGHPIDREALADELVHARWMTREEANRHLKQADVESEVEE